MSSQGTNIYERTDGIWEGRYVKYRSNVGFNIIAEEWLMSQKPELKPSSISKYKNIINTYLIPKFRDRNPTEITRLEVSIYSKELLSSGGSKGTGLSPKTVNGILSVLKNIFDYLQKEKLIDTANIKDISVKQSQKHMRILSVSEQKRLSEYLRENISVCSLGILLCMYTGLRIGEICALKWKDIFIREQYLYVRKTMQRIQIEGLEKKTKVLIQSPKSNCSIRKIPLPDEMINILIPFKTQDEAFLLTGRTYQFVEPRSLENHFKSVTKKCSIYDVNFHALRHTFATRCVELGFDIKSLSEILGHASVNITLNRYVHPSMELKKMNMNKLSEFLTKN